MLHTEKQSGILSEIFNTKFEKTGEGHFFLQIPHLKTQLLFSTSRVLSGFLRSGVSQKPI